MTPYVNAIRKALVNDNVGPHFKVTLFIPFFTCFLAVHQAQMQTGTCPLFLGRKTAKLLIKAKGGKLKFSTTNRGPAYPVYIGEEEGRRRKRGEKRDC